MNGYTKFFVASLLMCLWTLSGVSLHVSHRFLVPVYASNSASEDCSRLPGVLLAHEQVANHAYKSAIDECTKVLKSNPSCSYAYYYRAMAFYGLGLLEKAAVDIETASNLNKRSAGIWDWAAKIHETRGQWQKAVDDLTSEMSLSSGAPRIEPAFGIPDKLLVDRARNYLALGKDELAYRDLTLYLLARPDSVEGLYLRGLYYERKAIPSASIRDYKHAEAELQTIPGGASGTYYGTLYEKILNGLKRLSNSSKNSNTSEIK